MELVEAKFTDEKITEQYLGELLKNGWVPNFPDSFFEGVDNNPLEDGGFRVSKNTFNIDRISTLTWIELYDYKLVYMPTSEFHLLLREIKCKPHKIEYDWEVGTINPGNPGTANSEADFGYRTTCKIYK